MATNENLIPIPGRLHSVATEGHVAGADEIYDDSLQKTQDVINAEIDEVIDDVALIDTTESSPAVVPSFDPQTDTVHVTAQTLSESQKAQVRTNIGLGDVDAKINQAVASEATLRASGDSTLQSNINAEQTRATNAENVLQTAIGALTQSDIVVVADHTAVPSPAANTIYREQGTTSYSDWMYYNGAWQKMAEYNNAIDDEPTAGSENLIKSGGVSFIENAKSLIDNKRLVLDDLVTDNNYYTTPFIKCPNEEVDWTVSEINNDAYFCLYDATLTRKNQVRATSAVVDGIGVNRYAYFRATFRKNQTGNIISSSGKVIWDNAKVTKDLILNIFNLLSNDGYVFGGFVTSNSLVPVTSVPTYYISTLVGQHNNFLDSNGNKIYIKSKYCGIIKSVFSDGSFSYWSLIFQFASEDAIFDIALETGLLFPSISNHESVINRPSVPQSHFIDSGSYQDDAGNTISVDNDRLAILRSSFSGGSFSSWIVEYLFAPNYKNFSDTYLCRGWATPSTVPIPPYSAKLANVYYFATQAGTYTNFDNIVVNNNEIAVLRSWSNLGVFSGWTKTVIANTTASSAEIEATVLQYFVDHPSAANQYVEFDTGANGGYVLLGPDTDGARHAYCIAVGNNTLRYNTGTKNISVGNDNMMNCSGDANTSAGYHSLYRNTSGNLNSGFGAESQDDNTTGGENTSIGAYSLQRNRLGSNNTAIGAYALKGVNGSGEQGTAPNRTNIGNTVIGHSALMNAGDNCNYNIAIGKNTMKNSGSISNSIVIGNDVEADKDHQMKLGDSNITEVVFCGNKKIIFNQDGTVTWTTIS